MKHPWIIIIYFFLTNVGAQTRTIEIHPNYRVASFLMSPTDYSDWKTNNEFSNDYTKRVNVFKDIYKKFDDEFDFIFLILNEDTKPNGLPHGQHIRISNNTSGIGLSTYNNGSNYGSAGKLKSILHLTKRNYLIWGPSLHELAHKWANNAIDVENVEEGTNVNSYNYRPHWGFTGGSTKGQLGGFQQNTLVDNGSGAYQVGSFGANANGGNSVPYSELELYLMGMIDISDVSDFDVFTNITSFTRNGATYDFIATARTTYTPTSLEALLGVRTPSYTTSQKNFKALVVILTDTPLTPEQWEEVDDDVEKFSRNSTDGTATYNFWEATQGLGSIEMGNLQNSVLGITDTDWKSIITIYPNPTNNNLNIIIPSDAVIQELVIYNSIGQKTITYILGKNEKKLNFDIRNYPSGMYYLHLKNDNNLKTVKKFIIN